MFKLKILAVLFAITATALSAVESVPQKANDITDWVTIPISFNNFEVEPVDIQLESIQVSFPTQPEMVNNPAFGELNAFISKDEEGMTYLITALKITDPTLTVRDCIEKSIAVISVNPNNEIVYTRYPDGDNGNTSGSFAFVRPKGDFNRMNLVKGMNYIYIMTTHVKDEAYINYKDAFEGTLAWDKIQHDTTKTITFFNSLNFLY